MGLKYKHSAAAACLPEDNWHPEVGTRCYAAGWGRLQDNKAANVLQEVDLKIISDERCMETPNAGYFAQDEMFCAGHLKGGKDACQVWSETKRSGARILIFLGRFRRTADMRQENGRFSGADSFRCDVMGNGMWTTKLTRDWSKYSSVNFHP